jgi:peptide-methionine (R)-S-oxide reductase
MMSMLPTLTEQMTRRQALLASLSFGALVSIASAGESEPEVTIVEFSDAGEKTGAVTVKKVRHTEAEWRKLLTLQQFYVTRKGASDLAFYGSYFKLHDPGLYRCLCCGTAVFSSEAKFESKSGFPCFSAPVAAENIRTNVDAGEEPKRVDVICKRCDAHLGYVYNDGPEPSHLRYAMSESALRFVPFKKSTAGA